MTLLVLTGATGTGKTSLSLEIAEAIAVAGGRAEVVNADAMQLYRGMDVGTAKLPPEERRGIPHHCLDLWAVTEVASVAVYRDAARAAIADVQSRGAVPILVGGSGLYVESVLRELEFPATDPDLRAELEQQGEVLGSEVLWRRLAAEDPAAASRIHSGNLRRIVRALEVITLTGEPYAAALPEQAPLWRPAARFTVEVPNEPLAERLAARARGMWAGGLLPEVRGLLPQGLADGPTASRAIGYAQAIAVLGGRSTIEAGLADTIRLTWRVVRRQRSWFARDESAVTLTGGAPGSVARVLAALE